MTKEVKQQQKIKPKPWESQNLNTFVALFVFHTVYFFNVTARKNNFI